VSDPRPIEERISRWLNDEAPDDVPNHILDAAFARSRTVRQDAAGPRVLPRSIVLRGRPLVLVAVALILLVALIAAAVVGALTRVSHPDLRTRIHDAGLLRVAVRSAPPQAIVPDAGLGGFDIDVANELGRRLGVRVDIVSISDQAASRATGAFDLELPSLPASALDLSTAVSGPAYYSWPHYLLIPASSEKGVPDDVHGYACAVDGDSGLAWARQFLVNSSRIVTHATDDECLADLQSGLVDAVVTAAIGPSDLVALNFARPIGGPPAEVRVVVARRSDEPAAFLDDVRTALRAMAQDGALGAMSRTRFGADLASQIVQVGGSNAP
jgi:polar amino acid transport system substrate-binding protein/cystine transport system substrate-binding protein